MDARLIRTALACKCPKCGQGQLYGSAFSLEMNERCEACGLDLSRSDAADGPAVFLIFLLGFALVPMALTLESLAAPPLWVHLILWGTLALGITLGALRPLKAYVLALQYKHRPGDWA